jgi:hypothetical protein
MTPEQARRIIRQMRRPNSCPSGDHTLASCDTMDECLEARPILEHLCAEALA